MKTLDEVIESITTQSGLEIRNVRKPERDRFWVDRDTYNDALLYLKMYRSDKIQWETDRKMWAEKGPEIEKKQDKLIKAAKGFQKAKAEMEEISADYVALKQWWAEQQDNPPLTWDELKEMQGKPVWMEAESLSIGVSPYWNDWYIIKSFSNDEFMCCNDGFEWAKEMQGRLWQAYRKERK